MFNALYTLSNYSRLGPLTLWYDLKLGVCRRYDDHLLNLRLRCTSTGISLHHQFESQKLTEEKMGMMLLCYSGIYVERKKPEEEEKENVNCYEGFLLLFCWLGSRGRVWQRSHCQMAILNL